MNRKLQSPQKHGSHSTCRLCKVLFFASLRKAGFFCRGFFCSRIGSFGCQKLHRIHIIRRCSAKKVASCHQAPCCPPLPPRYPTRRRANSSRAHETARSSPGGRFLPRTSGCLSRQFKPLESSRKRPPSLPLDQTLPRPLSRLNVSPPTCRITPSYLLRRRSNRCTITFVIPRCVIAREASTQIDQPPGIKPHDPSEVPSGGEQRPSLAETTSIRAENFDLDRSR
jgi:hypothetical protein